MPRPSFRPVGLLLAAALTLYLSVWLAAGQSQAVGLRQDTSVEPTPSVVETPVETSSPIPGETPTDTPVPPTPETPTETPTEIPVETPTETPTDTPVPDTPTPEATATPLPTPTETPTPTPTVRPVVILTPTPEPTLFSLAGQVVDAALTSAAWIWLTCGSLVFFAVAGAIAGLSFYRQSRRRFDLYEIVPEEETNTPAQKGTERGRSLPSDEDSWPSSLP
ncbi:MAG: hypothetical protein HY328_02495 [Chloroflexi bacterium]|nr:hypothetical protein [Chloroflexota bacterium]